MEYFLILSALKNAKKSDHSCSGRT